MRPLNTQQASRCEHATTSRCRCRCGGRLHGAGRGEVIGFDAGDPHAVNLPAELGADAGGNGVQLSLFAPDAPTNPAEWLQAIRGRLQDRPNRRPTMTAAERPLRRPDGHTAALAGIDAGRVAG